MNALARLVFIGQDQQPRTCVALEGVVLLFFLTCCFALLLVEGVVFVPMLCP
jgi:hypothetical protein